MAEQQVRARGMPVALWLAGFLLAVYLELATVYVLLSVPIGIWRHTTPPPPPLPDEPAAHGTRRRPGEGGRPLSAYSVFNPDLQKLDGTLDADAIDRELRRRPF
jgi:hypothetical protein